MRFDLEIQPITVGLRFVNASNNISSSYIPVLYLNTNEINIVPADFVSIDTGSKIDTMLNLKVKQETLIEGNFISDSNQILITHIAKYSKITGAKYPLFFKHKLQLDNGIIVQSVRLYNETGDLLDSDQFIIESTDTEAYIYINPIINSLLTVEWADSAVVHRECLKLEPVFTDRAELFLNNSNNLGQYGYAITSTNGIFTCHTNRTGTIFYTSKFNYEFVRKPVGNINQPWYLLINNITINAKDKDDNDVTYRLPEYSLQKQSDALFNPSVDVSYKSYTSQVCKILDGKYIKTQMPPSLQKLNDVYITLYDKVSMEIVGAYTTNINSVNTTSGNSGILWAHISRDNYSYDGIFTINKSFDPYKHIAYADYIIDNIYYEYRLLDLNSMQLSQAKFIALYLLPDYSNSVSSSLLRYTFISTDDGKSNSDKKATNGNSFGSMSQYESFIASESCLHLGYVTSDTGKLKDILNISYCGDSKEVIFNELDIASANMDLVYNSILNKNFSLQMNDTAISYVNNSVYMDEETAANPEIAFRDNEEYMNFIDNIVKENVTVSTKILSGRNIISSVITGGN